MFVPCCFSSSCAEPLSTSRCASNLSAGVLFGKIIYVNPLSSCLCTRFGWTGKSGCDGNGGGVLVLGLGMLGVIVEENNRWECELVEVRIEVGMFGRRNPGRADRKLSLD